MRRVLVTGATGFIGRALVPVLLDAGYAVRAACRSGAFGEHPRLEQRALPDLEQIDAAQWAALIDDCEGVIHLAALAHITDQSHQAAPETYLAVNAVATATLADAVALTPGVERLVFISSASVVADAPEPPVEGQPGAVPRSHYARSKYEAERRLVERLATTACDYVIIRPSLVYGRGNPGNMERLQRLVAAGVPLPFGALDNRRSFAFVGNVVHAIERCLALPDASRGIFFVADPTPVSTPELVRMVAAARGCRVRLVPVPLWSLRLLARLGDRLERVTGAGLPFNSYSVDKLGASFVVDTEPLTAAIGPLPYATRAGIRHAFSGDDG